MSLNSNQKAFLKKAVYKYIDRKAIVEAYKRNGVIAATDGYRLHMVPNQDIPEETFVKVSGKFEPDGKFPDFLSVVSSVNHKYSIQVLANDLKQAIKQIRSIYNHSDLALVYMVLVANNFAPHKPILHFYTENRETESNVETSIFGILKKFDKGFVDHDVYRATRICTNYPTVTVNAQYIYDFVIGAGKNDVIEIEFSRYGTPIFIKNLKKDYSGVIMPFNISYKDDGNKIVEKIDEVCERAKEAHERLTNND